MLDIEGVTLSAEDRNLLAHPLVGGVILFARNYQDPAQVRALVAEIRALREPRLLVAVDQEGGRVQRFRHDFVELPALSTLGACYDKDPELALTQVADHAWLMASELRAVGIDFSFAPVLDLRTPHSAIIGDRAFHAEPRTVGVLARAYIAALNACGMAAVGKHFPGHGCVAADSHIELPVDKRDFYDIEQADLLPFRMLIASGLHGIMMAHVLYPAVDNVAAGYSRVWIREILRQSMRFEGVVFSDDLSMEGAAVSDSYADRAHHAIAAGCDVLLICNHRAAALEVIEALKGEKFPQTQARLIPMHARGRALELSALQQTPRWRSASARIEAMNRFPELELGDDNLLG